MNYRLKTPPKVHPGLAQLISLVDWPCGNLRSVPVDKIDLEQKEVKKKERKGSIRVIPMNEFPYFTH